LKAFLLTSFSLIALWTGPALAQSLTIQGKVLDGSNNPVAGAATQFRVKILSPDTQKCVLFDETQTIDLSGFYGLFSINLNDGRGTQNAPANYTLNRALSNQSSFTVDAAYCGSGTGTGTFTYTPGPTDNRKVVIQFRDPATMGSWETIPEMDLNPVAFAMEARTVGGFPSSSLLRVVGGGLPGTAPALTAADVTELQALTAGTSSR
jgi:trimeric autotransporter adhesin